MAQAAQFLQLVKTNGLKTQHEAWRKRMFCRAYSNFDIIVQMYVHPCSKICIENFSGHWWWNWRSLRFCVFPGRCRSRRRSTDWQVGVLSIIYLSILSVYYLLSIYLLSIYLSSGSASIGGEKAWIFDGDNGTDEIIFQTFTRDKLGQALGYGCLPQTCHVIMFWTKSTILPPSPFCHTYRKWVFLKSFLTHCLDVNLSLNLNLMT